MPDPTRFRSRGAALIARCAFAAMLVCGILGAVDAARGQAPGGQGGGQGGGPGGGQGGGALNVNINETGGGAAGVVIDANGTLRMRLAGDQSRELFQERRKAAVAALPPDLGKRSPLRKVALSRLEAEVAKVGGGGRGLPDDVQKLAGLTRVRYVFVYPAEGDNPGEIVIAGPAEPWMADASGRIVGVESGSPTVLLEDLAAAVRTFAPGQPHDRLIGCSIDPTQEGLAAMQDFLRKTGRINPQGGVDAIVGGMKAALGPQTVSVQGVSPATHFAQVMVEADYRMKLIGIGLERPVVKMATWVDLAAAGSGGSNALKRWYFVPDYRCIRMSEDDLAIELVGPGVKLCGADEMVLPDGRRMDANQADRASKMFTETFTKKYADIAARNPVYAQLRTLVDLAVAAAYMQEHDAYGRARWGAETLVDEQRYAIERHQPPTQVETAINAVWRGNRLLTPIGGGVTMHPRMALDSPNLIPDDKGEVGAARTTTAKLPAARWWWD